MLYYMYLSKSKIGRGQGGWGQGELYYFTRKMNIFC